MQDLDNAKLERESIDRAKIEIAINDYILDLLSINSSHKAFFEDYWPEDVVYDEEDNALMAETLLIGKIKQLRNHI